MFLGVDVGYVGGLFVVVVEVDFEYVVVGV